MLTLPAATSPCRSRNRRRERQSASRRCVLTRFTHSRECSESIADICNTIGSQSASDCASIASSSGAAASPAGVLPEPSNDSSQAMIDSTVLNAIWSVNRLCKRPIQAEFNPAAVPSCTSNSIACRKPSAVASGSANCCNFFSNASKPCRFEHCSAARGGIDRSVTVGLMVSSPKNFHTGAKKEPAAGSQIRGRAL